MSTPLPTQQPNLVHPKERIYFVLAIIVSIVTYVLMFASIFGIAIAVIILMIGFVAHGLFIGTIRSNAIRVSEKQFPEIDALTKELTQAIGLKKVPAVYILESGGFLNAFATRFLRKDFVILFSEVVELAYEEGKDALAFVIAHELAHLKCRHILWQKLLWGAWIIPYLGAAYSRACELTCDRYGAYYRKEGALHGLLALAAGKRLYRQVNHEEILAQAERERGFWVFYATIFSTHPPLIHRVKLLADFIKTLPK
ncbi:MAG: M48 family metallopeptidase [bacterium]|nr:M48 family metallopeptidase [bacterium]